MNRRFFAALLALTCAIVAIWWSRRDVEIADPPLTEEAAPSIDGHGEIRTVRESATHHEAARTSDRSSLRVRVVGPHDEPIPGVRVEALRIEVRSDASNRVVMTDDVRRLETGRDGVASLEARSGHWLVRAHANRAQRPDLASTSALTRVIDTRDVVLRLETARASLDLHVVDTRGADVANQDVILQHERQASAAVVSPGSDRPIFLRDKCAHRGMSSVIYDATRCFACHAKGTSAPRTRAIARLAHERARGRTDDGGRLVFHDVPKGRYRVLLSHESAGWKRLPDDADAHEVELVDGVTKTMRIRTFRLREYEIEVKGSVSGAALILEPIAASDADVARVAARSGIPAARVRAFLAGRSRYVRKSYDVLATNSIRSGLHFAVELPPGSWRAALRLSSQSQYAAPPHSRIEIGGSRASSSLRLTATKTPHVASGTFLDADGHGIGGLHVIARRDDGSYLKDCETNADGTYRMRGLPSGPIYICWHRARQAAPPLRRVDFERDARRFAGPTPSARHRIDR